MDHAPRGACLAGSQEAEAEMKFGVHWGPHLLDQAREAASVGGRSRTFTQALASRGAGDSGKGSLPGDPLKWLGLATLLSSAMQGGV